MRNYSIFLKKELFEAFKTHKMLIMGAVFVLMGMMSPLVAKFTPEILKWAMESDPATAGMDLSVLVTEPVAYDSWVQFFGQFTGQIGLVVLVIVFSGMLSSEVSRGTLTIMLSKGLSRSTVILSKLTGAVLIWTVSYSLSALTAWGYTVYMFEGEIYDLLFSLLCLWLFGVLLLALTALMATLTKKSYACMLSVGAVSVILALLTMIPRTAVYNPSSLISSPLQLLSGDTTPRNVYPTLVVTGIVSVAFALSAVISFSKKEVAKRIAILAGAAVLCIAVTVFIGEEVPRQIKLSRHATSENVTIGAGTEWELSGILSVPKHADGKVPAVVMVHGSGPNDMDETIFDNKPFRDIAEYLSSSGIAVIRYNKRTLTHGMNLSESTGLTVWEETIEDALLATAMLKADPRIDENRVYILGHSLGGMLAPRIHASGGDYAGLILLAGSPRFLLDISADQVMALVDATEDEHDRAEILKSQKLMEEEFELILSLPDEEVKNTHFTYMGNMGFYWKDLYINPVAKYIELTTAPFLVMQPDDDVQVLTDVDFAMYQELLANRTNVTYKLYPGLNHLFMPSTGRDISEIFDEYRIKASVDKQVLTDIALWINAAK